MEKSDVIVVGGGIMGLATAWHLVRKENKKVLLLDQFPFPTTRNSSTGQSRIYRRSYANPVYSAMMDAAIPVWRELEELSKTKLLHQCGLLFGGKKEVLTCVENSLKKNGSPHHCYLFDEVQCKWPQLKHYDATAKFIHDPGAGFITASAAMQAYHSLLMQDPNFTHLPQTKVLSVHPSSVKREVRVLTTGGRTYLSESLVITAGPWAHKFLQEIECPLPLIPQKVALAYFKVINDKDDSLYHQNFPTMVVDNKSTNVYLIPEAEYPGMIKLGNHNGMPSDPDRRDSNISDTDAIIKPLTEFVRLHLPSVDPTPAIIENCTYCCTPDHHYIIDRHPHYQNIAIGAGFSGHGFKMAPVVGQLLGKLCLGVNPDMDISTFRISRFQTRSKL